MDAIVFAAIFMGFMTIYLFLVRPVLERLGLVW
jgi:hypothetical protein